MTNQQHPIVPDPELLQEWYDDKTDYFTDMIRAAQWGADQELEACCEWLGDAPVVYNDNGDLHPGPYLRDARRFQLSSLKEQALKAMHRNWNPHNSDDFDTIRRALEQLND
jgi:hypothetical protein